MLRVAVLGCGRIGRMHAANVARHPRTSLAMVYDIDAKAAAEVAEKERAKFAKSPEDVFGSKDVDAVLIATATPTHADYIEMAVAAGKPHELKRFGAKQTEGAEPYLLFFLERYNEAFMAEIDAFVEAVETGRAPSPSFEDGRQALILAEAAYKSLREGRLVKASEISA